MGCPEGRPYFSAQNTEPGVLIKRGLSLKWCFHLSVAEMQHTQIQRHILFVKSHHQSSPRRRPTSGKLWSEPHSKLGLDRVRIALEIRHGDAVAPGIFEPEIDKRDRAPEQIGMSDPQQLVVAVSTR